MSKIDNMLTNNLRNKLMKEVSSDNHEKAVETYKRLENLYKEQKDPTLSLEIYFTLRGFRRWLELSYHK